MCIKICRSFLVPLNQEWYPKKDLATYTISVQVLVVIILVSTKLQIMQKLGLNIIYRKIELDISGTDMAA